MPESMKLHRVAAQRLRHDPSTLLFAPGYGCDHTVWQGVVDRLQDHDRVLFDWPGAGTAGLETYDPARHDTLDGYADDLLLTIDEQKVGPVVCVAHSVAGSIALIAASRRPESFKRLVLVSPSPCFLNDAPEYQGGFSRPQLEQLVHGLSEGLAAWSRALAPVIVGDAHRFDVVEALADRFCAMDPTIALRWAKATFFADVRALVHRVSVPTNVLQSRNDALGKR